MSGQGHYHDPAWNIVICVPLLPMTATNKSNNIIVIQHGTVNNGRFGFHYFH